MEQEINGASSQSLGPDQIGVLLDNQQNNQQKCERSLSNSSQCPNSETHRQDLHHVRKLNELPTDVLVIIFRKLDLTSLGKIAQVCHYFNRLVEEDTVWAGLIKNRTVVRHRKSLLKQVNHKIQCSLKERYRLSINWEKANFQSHPLIRHSSKQIPWLHYDGHSKLWLSTDRAIKSFNVNSQGFFVKEGNSTKLQTGPKQDITRFVVKDDVVVSGCRDGSVWGWDTRSGSVRFSYQAHPDDSQCVDFHNGVVVSGSVDKTIKISNVNSLIEGSGENQTQFPVGDRVWSIAMAPDGSMCTSGTAGNKHEAALSVWDLNRLVKCCDLDMDLKQGAGIFDIKYESSQILLTCGYDTYLRMWDTRCQECVCKWADPYDYAVYTVQSDGHMTLFTGTARHGTVRLWDKRNTKKPIKLYFAGAWDSPVYSLGFDSFHLFAALDLSVNMLDFSGYYHPSYESPLTPARSQKWR